MKKGFIIAILIIAFAITVYAVSQSAQNNQLPADSSTVEKIGSFKGEQDAKIKMIEYSDFECPYCARFYRETLPQIEKEYVEKGLVRLEFRQFPLTKIHPYAQKAAEASLCAEDQGKFWEMHDILFEQGVMGGDATLKKYAKEIGLDEAQFNNCLDSGSKKEDVADDIISGSASGVRGTPAFLINGDFISGAQPFAVFKEAIEKHLNQ